MRRRQLNSGDSVTLFPFLAVLICTMGSLIVLLVVVVQQARASADTASSAVDNAIANFEQERTARLQSKETLDWKIKLLEETRERTEADLAKRRIELSHLEDHIRTLTERLSELQFRAKSIVAAKDEATDNEHDLKQKVAELETNLLDAEADYKRALAEYQTKEKSYSIVAYAGPHGTERQPIFIECLADKIVLQPEGVELNSEDFRDPITDDNPLAMALRAKREYISKATAGESDVADPYPLLVVKPGGSQAYVVAREAMRSWDSAFGYELIPDDVKLSYPTPDPALRDVVEEAVIEARQRREELMAIAPSRFGRSPSSSGGSLRASRNGGFVATGDDSGGGYQHGQGDGFGGFGSNEFNQAGLGNTSGSESFGHQNGGTHGRYPENRGQGTSVSSRTEGEFSGSSDNGSSQFAEGSGGPNARGGLDAGVGGFGQNGSQSQQPGQSNSASSGSSAGASGAQMPGAQASGGASLSAGSASGQADQQQSLARTRGRNWGLPSHVNGGTGITRPISVTCYSDRIVMHSDKGARLSSKTFEIKSDVRSEVDKVVSSIWSRIDSWGIAGTGMYWKPVLNVRVAPQGEQVYRDLEALLDNSGITVTKRN
ncbi:MAG: hypothetical protein KDB27_15130 [Planctomycetales bacterium]|nr:hypothetical protein [Planctomycetales bacterium]